MDFEELLTDEPSLPDSEAARVDADAYGRIIDVTREALESCVRHVDELPEAARDYVRRNNIDLLSDELRALERRRTMLVGLADDGPRQPA
ncbi:MAG: hypothetical protein ABR564_02220 [Candidatus Dormibacteria bacterium]